MLVIEEEFIVGERCRWSELIGEGINGIEGREVLVKEKKCCI